MYIQATGNISPQNTLGQPTLPANLSEYNTNRLYSIEPDYSKLIDVKLIRRMSRIIKMGVAAALQCLQEAGVENPDAIITGTAYGCLEDTGVFLQKMVQNKEEMLTPTAFIQSTHNTIGAQIALLLKCHGYNNTFVHRGFSFESALLDAIMLLEEKTVSNVLIGGVDEITDFSFGITSRFGLFKKNINSNLNLFDTPSKGTIAGEGAAFFLLNNHPSQKDYALLDGVSTFYKPIDLEETEHHIQSFLSEQSISMNDIDLVLCGRNGDSIGDKVYDDLNERLFEQSLITNYKHLCGDYPTSTAFALWLAAGIIKSGSVPEALMKAPKNDIKRILIYNHYQKIHHSLMLVSTC
ncbi:MAG: beta-ketoacyl synthase chain length factor [Chitinophagaceae bacterium]|nr:beta-ketoacyl synthase chain length factor [Chitinophagaceae bacterium]